MSLNVDTLITKLEAHHMLDASTVPLFRKLVAESDDSFVPPVAENAKPHLFPSAEKIAALDATAAERLNTGTVEADSNEGDEAGSVSTETDPAISQESEASIG